MMSSLRHQPEATETGREKSSYVMLSCFYFILFCQSPFRSLFLVYFFFDLGTAFQVPRQHGGAR